MSSTQDTQAPARDEALSHGYGEEHGYEAAEHGSLKGYLIGFVLSIVLTAIPFWLVMGDVLASTALTVVLILALGVVQIYVHLSYFLHIDTTAEGGWQLMSTAFTIILIFIVLVGSIWVMGHLNSNMMLMPMSG